MLINISCLVHDLPIADVDAPFLCDPANKSLETYPHPVDSNKFYMCDRSDNTFLGLCPVGLGSCTQFTSGCKYANPCTLEALNGGKLHHEDPCGNLDKYVTCTQQGVSEVISCPPNRIWNEDTSHCVFEAVYDPKANTFYTNVTNPCTHAHGEHVYFPFPSKPSMYIFCNQFGDAYASTCKDGVWNEQMRACTQKSTSLVG